MTRLCLAIIAALFSYFISGYCQRFEVGVIDYYGLRKPGAPSKEAVHACLPLSTGDTIDFSVIKKAATVECLERLPGVTQADFSPVCCTQDNKVMIFLGVTDQAKKANGNSQFSSDLKLPKGIVAAYDALDTGMTKAIASGQAAEDDTEGHTLFSFPGADAQQKKFIDFANNHLAELKNVLTRAKDPKQRGVASWVIAYHRDKRVVAPNLAAAAGDPDAEVRNNAIRGLGIMMNYLDRKGIAINIDPSPFVDLLQSVDWTDRNKSAFLLEQLTRKRDPVLLARLKKDALLPLADMAAWQSPGHAQPGFIMLGRLAGWDDKTIFERIQQDRGKWVETLLLELGRK